MSGKLLLVALVAGSVLMAQDPPTRVGRLNFVAGSVSFQPGGADDWVSATINRPLTVGDQLFADNGAQAEIHIPGTAFRLGSRTAFEFMNLDDRIAQVRLSEGSLNVRVRRLDSGQSLEVDTPNGAFTILRPGQYRIDANPDSNQTYVTVRAGDGEITSDSGAFAVHTSQQAVLTGQNPAQYAVYAAPGNDDFDTWVQSRDVREDRFQSSRYVSPEVVGYEDLDDNGTWESVPDYGQVWTPRGMPAGWAPYHNGHWAWVDPWGWTWVDDAPWGFAPFHYGRWAYLRARWCWVPGPMAVRPVYAPALVAWFGVGGGGARLSVGFGGGGGVGWFPLSPRDVYLPSYRSSPTYVTRINTSNTTVINNVQITNVYNNYVRTGSVPTASYGNRAVPGAMVAVPQNSFAGARPVQQVAVKVQPNQINSVSRVSAAPRVAPQMASVLGRPAGGASVPRPAPAVVNRSVVAKATPPPAPASFQQRQALLAKDPGRPIPIQQQQKIARPAPVAPVQVVSQVRQVTPQVANKPAPAPARVAQRPAAPPTPSPAAPATAARPGQTVPPTPQSQAKPVQAQPNRPVQPPAAQPQPTPQTRQNRPVEPPRERPAVPQPNRPVEPPGAQPRPTPQGQQNRPVEPARAAPQPNRPVERPAAQPRPTPKAQPNRPVESPGAVPQANRSVEPPAAQPRPAAPQAQQNRPVEQPRAVPQPNRPAERPAAQPRPTPQAPQSRPVEPARAAPQSNRPVERPAAQPRPTPQAQPNRPVERSREQPRPQQQANRAAEPPARQAQQPAKGKPADQKKTDEKK